MTYFKIEAPWFSFNKKLKALFELDPEVNVGDVYEIFMEDAGHYGFTILVTNEEKRRALYEMLPPIKMFGDVVLVIRVIGLDSVENQPDHGVEMYEKIFKGNRLVKDIKRVTDKAGTERAFVRFEPVVLQFFDDDLTDYEGIWSGIAQDIAREVFGDIYTGVSFCTANVKENAENAAEVNAE